MLTILLLLAALAGDPKPAVNVGGNLGLDGFDAVAYVTDGKSRVQKRWEADIPGYIIKGQANWPDVLKK